MITRRGLLGVFSATLLSASPVYANVFGFLKGAGDIRQIKMYSGRTGESVNTIYWIDGEYIPEALSEINYFMRDWRTNEVISIDTKTIDIAAAVNRLLETDEHYTMLSGYRSAKTNAILRKRSRGVAKNSFHISGQAADLRLKSRTVSQMAHAALSCRSGGVGRYTRSNFVHMDCGPIRQWAR